MYDEETQNEIRNLARHLHISIRYHAKRQRFFANFHRLVVTSNAILGTSSFVLLLGNFKIALLTTGMLAIMSTLDLVLQFAQNSELHKNLRCQFIDLIKEINAEEKTLKDFKDKNFSIEKDEPATLKGLCMICHNEHFKAIGEEEMIYEIPFRVKLLKHFWSFDNLIFEKLPTTPTIDKDGWGVEHRT